MTLLYFISIFIWTILFEGVFAGEYCYNWYYSTKEYCDYGCCGDDWDRGCCSLVGIIVGACLGGLALIAFIIVVICCCVKQKGKSGRVIGTTNTTSVAVVGQQNYTTMQTQPTGYSGQTYGQPYPSGSVPPPTYPAQYPPGPPPSAGMYNDPAYPPMTAPPPYKQ